MISSRSQNISRGRVAAAQLQNGSRAGYAASAMTWLARLYKWGGHVLNCALVLRSHPHGNYVIFFHYVGEAFEVVNVLEGHRDVAAFFGSDER